MDRRAPNHRPRLRQIYRTQGQDHVLRFWDRLGDADRERLLAQTRRLAAGLPAFSKAQRRAIDQFGQTRARALEPAPAVRLPETPADERQFSAARTLGQQMLEAGRVAVLVVAGGQGMCFGYPGPKGAYPVGPVSQRSLFELQAQKIRGLTRRTGHSLPWYVMTSHATRSETLALFESQKYFGLERRDVFFLMQDAVPVSDFEGRFLLDRPHHIAESPNGHGGVLPALLRSGTLDDMRARGVERIFYYQVDNPLVRIADPIFLGFHQTASAEMSCKVVRKRDPYEKVGVLARVDGRLGIVEYTELGDREATLRDERGLLLHWAGNIAIHVFDTDFVRRVATDADRLLPYHASAKKIPCLDEAGHVVEPAKPNGYKLERFVFDALPEARSVCALEADAADEFSPVKNAEGKDSVKTARHALSQLYRRWLGGAKIALPPEPCYIELDHSRIDDAEEAISSGFTSLADAGDAIRVATGMDS